jgi:hypothetical protein
MGKTCVSGKVIGDGYWHPDPSRENGGRVVKAGDPCPKCFGGVTIREFIRLRRAELPRVEWVRIDRRPFGPWMDMEAQWDEAVPFNPPRSSAGRFLTEALKEELSSAIRLEQAMLDAVTKAQETFAPQLTRLEPESRTSRLLPERATFTGDQPAWVPIEDEDRYPYYPYLDDME